MREILEEETAERDIVFKGISAYIRAKFRKVTKNRKKLSSEHDVGM